ncbi:MAG: hypothetical protein P4L46_00305 [Fimbriimonas sp.]|nr:hypothetical protein [Fimbriimonas sp.]
MRSLPHNFVLVGRRSLRASALIVLAASCGSCARFPSNSGAGNFTAITFSFSVAGKINDTVSSNGVSNYIYDVAIAASPLPNPDIALAPVPVINSSSPNGRVAGSPNVFVEFNSLNPTTSLPFSLYRFALASEVPNPNDPTNPVNLGVYTNSTRGQIINFTTPETGGDASTLTFTLYTNELADTDAEAKALQTLYVNILTMTRPANQGSGTRVIDALGDSRTVNGLNNFLAINLLKSGSYTNAAGFEPTGDTFGGTEPDVDIVNYTITVTPP